MKPQRAPRTKSQEDLARHKLAKEAAKTEWKPEYYNCNNNLVILDEGLRSHVASGVFNGRCLYYFFGFGAKAQCEKKRSIEFQSEEALIRGLGLNVRKREREALHNALAALSNNGFDIPAFYHWGETKKKFGMTKAQWVAHKREVKGWRTRHRTFERILRVRHHLDHRIKIAFDKELWKATKKNGFFSQINLEVARELRRPHVMLLALLIEAKSGTIEWYPGTIAKKIGLHEKQPDRVLAKLRLAVKRISEATGQRITFRVLKSGLVRIHRPESKNQ